MLGLPKGEVYLVPWSRDWEREFVEERLRIRAELGDLILAVHHIGSTAVKGLSAKPILDLAVELKNYELGVNCVQGLENLGYKYRGTDVLPDRHYFSKGEPRTHQIHMFQSGNIHLKRQLAFRDYLLSNNETLKEYQALKERLSQTYGEDKLAYSEAKTDFIYAVLKKVGQCL